jgi:predicted MFS family arabinose efflux permease
MSIQPLYMKVNGFSDSQSADYISYRFLGVLLLAFPLGLIIKGKKLKNLFYISSVFVPIFAICIILFTDHHVPVFLYLSQFMWGASFTFIQIPILTFILRNAKKETRTMAIALSYSTWSFAGIISGWMISILNKIDPILFNEKNILLLISLLGFLSIYFVSKINIQEQLTDISRKRYSLFEYDWLPIIKALAPTLIIAVGAGLTIPFMSLFFSNVHGLSTAQFAFVSSVTSVLVVIGSLSVPKIKETIGYKIAIPTTQAFAVIALVLLATTQYYNDIWISVYIAVGCYIIRQPLMNMANPMTSELVMNYTGKKNHEIVSALTSAIWSGSWFISSRIFKELREEGYSYVNVFLITATLYAVGVIWYYFLVLDYHKKEKNGLINS